MAPPLVFALRVLLLILPLLSSFPAALSASRCNPHDKRALFQIKKALGDPNVLVTWTADTDCCGEWANIRCDSDTGRVVSLEVSFSDASGLLPPVIGDLHSLNVLSIRKNRNVRGPIPPELAKLTNLRELWLDMNHLTGPVPDFLGRMTTLEYINLASNKLSGYIPPSLGDLPRLQGLFLDDNRLTGLIPASLGRLRHPTGLYIVLSRNQLAGPVPPSFRNLNISKLDLSRNRLTGDPSVLFRTADLVTSQFTVSMDLSRNWFEFDLSVAEFSTKLGSIDLSHNRIYGKIPAQLGKIDALEYLDLSYNRLCGEIPQGGRLQMFIKDQFLHNSYNRLCGEIPQGGRLQMFIKDQFLHNRCLCGEPLPPCK